MLGKAWPLMLKFYDLELSKQLLLSKGLSSMEKDHLNQLRDGMPAPHPKGQEGEGR